MINRVVLVGRLTKQPELAQSSSNIPYVRFTLAVNRTFSNQSGEKEADFISCIAWRKQAENLCKFMAKGSLIGVEGRIMTGSYEGKDGQRVYTTDIVAESIQFLEKSREQSSEKQPSETYQSSSQPSYGGQSNLGNQNVSFGHQQSSFGGAQQNYNRQSEQYYDNSHSAGNGVNDDLPF